MQLKKFLFIFMVFLYISNIAASSRQIIDSDGLGEIKIGDDISKIYNRFNKELTNKIDLMLEGVSSPAIEVFLNEKDKEIETPAVIYEEYPEGHIWRINVLSNQFKTINGIGVGSTLADLKEFHKGIIITGEENIFFYTKGLSFLLDVDMLQYLKSKEIPSTTIVKSVLISGSN